MPRACLFRADRVSLPPHPKFAQAIDEGVDRPVEVGEQIAPPAVPVPKIEGHRHRCVQRSADDPQVGGSIRALTSRFAPQVSRSFPVASGWAAGYVRDKRGRRRNHDQRRVSCQTSRSADSTSAIA